MRLLYSCKRNKQVRINELFMHCLRCVWNSMKSMMIFDIWFMSTILLDSDIFYIHYVMQFSLELSDNIICNNHKALCSLNKLLYIRKYIWYYINIYNTTVLNIHNLCKRFSFIYKNDITQNSYNFLRHSYRKYYNLFKTLKTIQVLFGEWNVKLN